MPPSSKRLQRKRRETQQDLTTTPTEEPTPTRPAKRRRKVRILWTILDHLEYHTNYFGTQLSDPEPPESEPPSIVDDDALVTQITQKLKNQPVQASKDHSNSIHEANSDGVKAYAKVAAQDWTFYITKLVINIGRAPEGGAAEASTGSRRAEGCREGGGGGSRDNDHGDRNELDEEHVQIDLGPSKTVSREHAIISFDSKNDRWLLTVKGRNGVRVNTRLFKSNEAHQLSSGEVMEIGGVEMMFVLPSEISPLHIHPSFLERCGLNTATPRSRALRQPSHPDPASVNYPRPGTPPPSTQIRHAPPSIKSPAFSTPGTVMVGANGADLSKDENKHIKPQYSYAQMITQAIISASEDKLTLNGIYTYITDQYAYYRHQAPSGWQVSLRPAPYGHFVVRILTSWQNSIRHNLSLNKHFEKVARSTYEPGKGAKWQLVPDTKEELVRNAWRIGRGGHRGSSAPSSPNQLNYITQGPRDMAARGSPSGRKRPSSLLASPPPRSSLPMSQSTPDGRLKQFTRANAILPDDGSPLPRSKKTEMDDPSFSNYNPHSPTLTSSFFQDDGGSFVTPAPPRVHPKLAPPSTAQRPSQHMPTSSPAPFWRFIDIASTPLRGTSPTKTAGPPPPQSSSPLRANKSPPSSPTRPQKETSQEKADPPAERLLPEKHEDEDDDDDDQGFDLAQ